MKKIIMMASVLMMTMCMAAPTWASKATKEECIMQCQKAAQLIEQYGVEDGIQNISNKKGPFVWKDTYVFLMNMDGEMLAHPMNPSLTRKGSLIKTPDAAGNLFFEDFIKVASSPGTGWVNYVWPKPGEKQPTPKSSYIYRVPDTPYFVGAGIYK